MNRKKTVTVITLQNIRNYGSALQALATQKIFESLGCHADFFDYNRKDNATPYIRIVTWTQNMNIIKKVIYAILLYPTFLVQNKKFKRFIKNNLNIIPGECHSVKDFEKIKLNSDIYCTGSDQTWNSGWNKGLLPEMFLSFVPDEKKKIAYSASFGKSKLDEWEKEETKKLLQRYKAISVRENSGVEIINDLGISGAVHVLDPTLQLNRETWIQLAGERKFKQEYVLVYQLNTNPQFDAYAKEYAKRKELKLLRFCTRFDQFLKPGKALLIPEVTDFINYILYADTVITDSFHATAFSINLNTNFISIYPSQYNSRLASILELTNLTERHLTSYNDYSFVENKQIDFTEANMILQKERESGIEFLKNAIE